MKIQGKFAHHYLPLSLSRHPTLIALLKHKDHPSIRAIKRVSQPFPSFFLSPVDKNAVFKEIRKLKSNKAAQEADIPVKTLEEYAEFLAEYIYLQYNEAIRSSSFPNWFKFANIATAIKQGSRNQNNN